MLYASTRSEQTDVVLYHLNTQKQEWRCATTQGSEYSPLRIPGSEAFSAIRLDTTGLSACIVIAQRESIPWCILT